MLMTEGRKGARWQKLEIFLEASALLTFHLLNRANGHALYQLGPPPLGGEVVLASLTATRKAG